MQSTSNINILVGGDFVPAKKTEDIAINNPRSLWGDSIELFKQSDLAIVNLEAPLTTATAPIIKTGPNLKLSPNCINALTCANINAVTLSNNHIRDHGCQGVKDTLTTCENNNIDTVGAGKNSDEASKTLFKTIKNKKIAIINFSENEWASSTDRRFGANPMDLIDNVRRIKEAKEQAEFILVIIHGGHEYYQYPSPRMVKQYQFYAEQGASMIIGHHPHCVSGYEIYNDVPIFYSLGNLFFPSKRDSHEWHQGMLLSIDINNSEQLRWRLIAYEHNKKGAHISLLKNEAKRLFFLRLNEINRTIASTKSLNRLWKNYSQEQEKELLSLLIPSPLLGKIIRKFNIKLPKYFIKPFAVILNQFRCEAHNDLTISALEHFVDKNKRS